MITVRQFGRWYFVEEYRNGHIRLLYTTSSLDFAFDLKRHAEMCRKEGR